MPGEAEDPAGYAQGSSWPLLESPQHSKDLSARIPQVWVPPVDSSTNSPSGAMLWFVPVSSDASLEPQQVTVPS